MNRPGPSNLQRCRDTRGFTLIELLVVIALIVLLVGVLGMAMRGGDRGTALQGAQGTLVSLFAGTRAQAALRQTEAALMVDVEPTSEGYLRTFRIAYKTTDGKWVADDPVTLPAGIYLVPNNAPTGVTLNNWNMKRVTTAFAEQDVADNTFVFNPGGRWRVVDTITQYGARVPPSADDPKNKIVLAPGERSSASELSFSNPDLVRGAIISHYGVLSTVNDAAGFDQS